MNIVLVIGSINFDLTQTGDKFPEIGETLIAKSSYLGIGGKGANQAVSASRLVTNSRVELIGCVGSDYFGKIIQSQLKKENLKISNIRTIANEQTGNAIIFIDKDQNNQICVHIGANSKCGQIEIDYFKKNISTTSVLVLQHEIPVEINRTLLKEAKKNNVLTILDPGPYIKDSEYLIDYFNYVDYLTPNLNEAESLLNEKIKIGDELIAAKKIKDMGPKNVIITLGGRGLVACGQENIFIPALTVNTVDPVGSGDCFNGALSVKLSEGAPLIEALHFSQKAASISTTYPGAMNSFPFISDL
tara:strand:- start:419 stop:1324 length:906 start_codon:yes stop_codon:yes gene_type:complete